MKMEDALQIIESHPKGFMVAFERREGPFLVSDNFPDVRIGEPAIKTEAQAWDMAEKFAAKTVGECVNLYVIRREDFSPVNGYESRIIANRGNCQKGGR